MSLAPRIALVLAAVLAAVMAFAVLRPDDEPAAVTAPDDSTPAAATPDAAPGTSPEATPEARPTRKPPLLTAGRVRTISVERDETVSFRVRHPSEEELHVHGYDISRRLPAERTVAVRFPAKLEGIFDIELEQSHTPIGRLRVEP